MLKKSYKRFSACAGKAVNLKHEILVDPNITRWNTRLWTVCPF